MRKNFHSERSRTTSWQKVAPWYNKVTRGGEGHYYHEHVVIPGAIRLLNLQPNIQNTNPNILDLACGNGVLAKSLPKGIKYTGVDLSESLIKYAKSGDKNYNHKYLVADITKPLNLPESFNAATIILALQNIREPQKVFENVSKILSDNCKLVIVLNHPAFRIPRQSSWGIDENRKIQYRRVDKYMSPMEIPIRMNPSDPQSEQTMSYHFPISDYSKMLKDAGFVIELIEEWTSDKESVGRAGRMENRSRAEIPLFMAILATKR
jgi:ubiquinone/menaquinone biosynthesis C-methylase UbiE